MEEPSESQKLAIEDATLAIEIFKKALEYRPLIEEAIVGQRFLSLAEHDRFMETTTPRIGLTYVDEAKTIPMLFFRFVGDGSPVVEAFFYPYEAILSFIAEARAWVRWISLPDRDPVEIEKTAFDHATDMTLIMLDSFYQRGELMMNSFTVEVIGTWHRENRLKILHYNAARGEILSLPKDNAIENAIEKYRERVLQFWKYHGQSYDNLQKIRLAEEYDENGIYKHWDLLIRMFRRDEDWREYSKAGKFADTPDDLLKKLPDTTENRVSELALEHAARRARLIKRTGVSESVLERRKKGIKVTGYSSAHLFEFLKEGRELKAKFQAQQAVLAGAKGTVPVQQTDKSARIEKAKSLEQKASFVRAKKGKPKEQKGDSALAAKPPK